MAKTGAFGLLRFAIPLFPEAAARVAPYLMLLGVAGVIYGAVVAYGAQDLRRLLAYSSMSHLGLLVAGAYSLRPLGYQGAALQMVAHGLSVAGLFLLIFLLEEDIGATRFAGLGGLWQGAPRFGALALVFVMATLGLPGLANFVGELLLLLGIYSASPRLAAVAVLAPVLSALYSLRLLQQVFLGSREGRPAARELAGWRLLAAAVLAALLIVFGLLPGSLLRRVPAPEAWQTAPGAVNAALSLPQLSLPQAEEKKP